MSGLTWRVGAAVALVTAVMGPLSPRPAPAATGRVVLAGMHFTPPRLEVALGDVVLWQANDDDHTVTARDGTFDSSVRGLMATGDEFRYRFRMPGSYPYFCRVHQSKGMQGEIVVVDPSASTSTTAPPTPATASASAPTTSSTTATTAPAETTTSRPLATSSTTSLSMATATTAPAGVPAVPQEAPALNPNARVVGSPAPGADLPEAQAAARRSGGSGIGSALAIGGVALVAVGAAGGGAVLRRGRRRQRGTGY